MSCGYQFFTTRRSRTRAIDEGALDFEEFEPTGAASAGARSAPPVPTPRGRGPPPKAPAKRVRKSGFLKVPDDLTDLELEALRYTAMKQALILVVVLVIIENALPPILNLLGIRIAEIGIVGIVAYVLILIFFVFVRKVAAMSKKPMSAVETAALNRIRSGGFILCAIPLLGSLLGQVGIFFQTNPMHPIYYGITGIGIAYTLSGVTSLKERYSYFAVFEFGYTLLLLHPLPALFPFLGGLFVNGYWFQTTFLMLAVGFIVMSMALRKMRAGQYETLEREVLAGQKALDAKQYDKSIAHFDRAVTIAHSLYSDKLFKTTRAGVRALPADYYLPWIGKATVLALSGRGAKALTILDIILEVDPANADLWMNKGEVLLAIDRPAEAYIAFEQAQRINPGLAAAGTNKARALTTLQQRME